MLENFDVPEFVFVLEANELTVPKDFVEASLAWLIFVLKDKVVASLREVLLILWVSNSFFERWVSVDSHFSSFIVEEINVDRIALYQSGKDAHALRQKHILHTMLVRIY